MEQHRHHHIHLHQALLLNNTSNTPPFSSPLCLSRPNPRCCYLNLIEDNLKIAIMKAGKPETFGTLDACNPSRLKRPRKGRNSGKQAGTLPSSEVMDEEIWKELPEDLLEAVIARLPISTFFHFRLVCRKWNSLLNSPSFSVQCAQAPQLQPWFYTITHENVNTGAIYDPSMKKWRHPTTLSLPPKVILLPVASAGGLICFLDIGHQYFYICNPLTQSWKELPPRSVKVWSRIAVGMIQNESSSSNSNSGYKIVWVGRDGEYEIYDSNNGSWAQRGNLSSVFRLPVSLNFRSQTVSIGSRVYFLRCDPDGMVSYDMETGAWKEYLIPAPPNSVDHHLARCGRRILLVGLLTKNAATCVCIWELQKLMLLWKEVDRMPNEQCLEFYGKHVRMTCLSNVDLLMLSLKSRQMNRIVTCDVAMQDWSKATGCMLPRGRKRQWIACGTAFYPCLTATP